MSTTIKYKNTSGNFITIQQSQQLDSFEKHTFINNVLKKVEEFSSGELNSGSLFLDNSEDYTDFLDTNEQKSFWFIYKDFDQVNGYTIRKNYGFFNGQFNPRYSKEILDNNDRVISLKMFDENDSPIPGSLKWFYLDGKPIIVNGVTQGYYNNDCYYEFSYEEDGSLQITPNTGGLDKPYTNLARFMDEEANGPLLNLMSNDELDFYLSPDEFIPDF